MRAKAADSLDADVVGTDRAAFERLGAKVSLDGGFTIYVRNGKPVFTGNFDLAKHVGLRTKRRLPFYNSNIECRLFKTVDCGSHRLYIGEIEEIHVDKACLTDGKPDSAKINPILYAQSTYYDLGKEVGNAFSVGKKYGKK